MEEVSFAVSLRTHAALCSPLQATKLHGDLGPRLAQSILAKMQLFMLRLAHLPAVDRAPGVTVAAHCILEYQRLADKGEREFKWDYPYAISTDPDRKFE